MMANVPLPNAFTDDLRPGSGYHYGMRMPEMWERWIYRKVGLSPTQSERTTFATGHASMQQGWSGTFEQLETYLGRIA